MNKIYEAGMKYSKQIGAIFKLTSAKENKGINELFKHIAEAILKQEA
jgi:GTPase SAR1 family protein